MIIRGNGRAARNRASRLGMIFAFVSLLPACASGPSKVSEGATASAVGLKAENSDVRVQITGLRDATEGWFEYTMTLSNLGNQQIDQFKASVIAENGESLDAASDSFELKEPPKIGESVLIQGAISVGGMGLAMAGIPLVGLVAGAGYMISRAIDADEQMDVALSFGTRSLTLKVMPGNDQIQGSFFLPAVKPASFRVGYVKEGRREWLVVAPDTSQTGASSTSPAGDTAAAASGSASPGSAAPIPPSVAAERTLSMADAQERLARRGYDVGVADGIFGARTERAIRAFQRDKGLQVTGQLDAATKAELLKD